MRSKIRLRSPRERGLAVLGSGFSRRLARSGRRDGRRGIPDSGDAALASPTQTELKSVAALSVHAVGADLFAELPPYDKRVAAARQRTRASAEAHDRAIRDEQEAAEAVRAAEAGGSTRTSSADDAARRHRRARALAEAVQAARGRLDEARTELAKALAERHDVAETKREQAWAVVRFAQAAESVYLAANLRVRRRSEPRPAALPNHVVFSDAELPLWLFTDEALDGAPAAELGDTATEREGSR